MLKSAASRSPSGLRRRFEAWYAPLVVSLLLWAGMRVAPAAPPQQGLHRARCPSHEFAERYLTGHEVAPSAAPYVAQTFVGGRPVCSGRLCGPVELLRLHGDDHGPAAQLGRFYGLLPAWLRAGGSREFFTHVRAGRDPRSCATCPHASDYAHTEDGTVRDVLRQALGVSSRWNPVTHASVVRFLPGDREGHQPIWFHVGPIGSVDGPPKLNGGLVQVVLHVAGDDGQHETAQRMIRRLLDGPSAQVAVRETVALDPPPAGARGLQPGGDCKACEIREYADALAALAAAR
jgi:hypothetical protein